MTNNRIKEQGKETNLEGVLYDGEDGRGGSKWRCGEGGGCNSLVYSNQVGDRNKISNSYRPIQQLGGQSIHPNRGITPATAIRQQREKFLLCECLLVVTGSKMATVVIHIDPFPSSPLKQG